MNQSNEMRLTIRGKSVTVIKSIWEKFCNGCPDTNNPGFDGKSDMCIDCYTNYRIYYSNRFKSRYTISDIKRINQESGYYYFSRDSLKCWNQKIRDFRVRHVNNRVFVYCAIPEFTFSEFFPESGRIIPLYRIKTKSEMELFLTAVKSG